MSITIMVKLPILLDPEGARVRLESSTFPARAFHKWPLGGRALAAAEVTSRPVFSAQPPADFECRLVKLHTLRRVSVNRG